MAKYHTVGKATKRDGYFVQVCDLFVPFVKPIVALRIKEETESITNSAIDSLAQEMVEAISQEENLDNQQKVELEASLKNRLDAKQESELYEEEVEEETRMTTSVIVSGWVSWLYVVGKSSGKLDVNQLDDMMWPIGQFQSRKEMMTADLVIIYEDMQSIFRAVKRSLPAGKALPDAAVEYLKYVGIEVIG